jgi:hypothetical protein
MRTIWAILRTTTQTSMRKNRSCGPERESPRGGSRVSDEFHDEFGSRRRIAG